MVPTPMPLSGSFALKILRSIHDIHTTTIDFRGLHDVVQAGPNFLGTTGNYFFDGRFLLMAFGDNHGPLSTQTRYMLFGQIIPGSHQLFEGVMCDNTTGDNMTWAAQAGGDFQPSLQFGTSEPINTKTFTGIEHTLNVHAFYRFWYSGSRIGHSEVGKEGHPPTFTGGFTSENYGVANQQLIILGGEILRVYGAVVEGAGPSMRFVDGLYMHPLGSPQGNYGIWSAQ